MGRVYGEPIEVQANEAGRPVRFMWRGRRYTVRAVIEHWVANREWWRDPDVVAPRQRSPGVLYWRVEAAAGQGMPSGTYELSVPVSDGAWTLRRVAD